MSDNKYQLNQGKNDANRGFGQEQNKAKGKDIRQDVHGGAARPGTQGNTMGGSKNPQGGNMPNKREDGYTGK